MMENRSIFLQKFFCAPTKIGSLTPSSQYLTRKMLYALPWDKIDSIVDMRCA